MVNNNELFGVKGMTLAGKFMVNAPLILASVIVLLAYTRNSGLFINPFAEVLWYALQWSAIGFMLANGMGKWAFKRQ